MPIPIFQFILPPPPPPRMVSYVCSLCLCLYCCFADKFTYIIFLDYTYTVTAFLQHFQRKNLIIEFQQLKLKIILSAVKPKV